MITPTQVKILAGVAAIFLTCWFSYDYGATSVREQWYSERAALNEATAKALVKVNNDNATLSRSLESAKDSSDAVKVEVRTETVEVEKEVIKYVTKYRDNTCVLDDDWLRIYATSAERSKRVTSTTK